MTPEERKQLDWLCSLIVEEKDPEIFDQLVRDLNALLDAKHERIHPEHHKDINIL
jgi:hypothetical protein